jgi:gas vesicle protein
MSTEKIVIGMLAGLAAGTALGVLFAPDKGSNTRKKISDKGNAMANELGAKYKDVKSEVSKTIDRVKDQYSNVMQDGQNLVEDITHKANQGADGLSKTYQKMK